MIKWSNSAWVGHPPHLPMNRCPVNLHRVTMTLRKSNMAMDPPLSFMISPCKFPSMISQPRSSAGGYCAWHGGIICWTKHNTVWQKPTVIATSWHVLSDRTLRIGWQCIPAAEALPAPAPAQTCNSPPLSTHELQPVWAVTLTGQMHVESHPARCHLEYCGVYCCFAFACLYMIRLLYIKFYTYFGIEYIHLWAVWSACCAYRDEDPQQCAIAKGHCHWQLVYATHKGTNLISSCTGPNLGDPSLVYAQTRFKLNYFCGCSSGAESSLNQSALVLAFACFSTYSTMEVS